MCKIGFGWWVNAEIKYQIGTLRATLSNCQQDVATLSETYHPSYSITKRPPPGYIEARPIPSTMRAWLKLKYRVNKKILENLILIFI